jgi:hypothetical protein
LSSSGLKLSSDIVAQKPLAFAFRTPVVSVAVEDFLDQKLLFTPTRQAERDSQGCFDDLSYSPKKIALTEAAALLMATGMPHFVRHLVDDSRPPCARRKRRGCLDNTSHA